MELRTGIIGVGGQGRSWLRRIKSYKKVSNSTLKFVAACDINEAMLKKIGEQEHCATHVDYLQMLEKEKLDLVIIATPHYVHAPISIAAAEHGVNVLVEKPMCINLKQAGEMKAAVEKSKIKLAVGFQHRFDPPYAGLKNMIAAGALGDIFQLNMIFHWWRKEDYFLNSSPVKENEDTDWAGWRGHWKTEGASALLNQMVHFIDIFQWLSPSPPKAVSAAVRVHKHTLIETDDNTNAVIEFENGSLGFLQAGVAYEYGKEEEYGAYGTKGAVVRRKGLKGALGVPKIYQDFRPKAAKKDTPIRKFIPWNLNLPKNLLANLVKAIENDDPKSISVDVNEGRKSVELIRGILLSQKHGKKITFPLEDMADEFPELPHTYADPQFKI